MLERGHQRKVGGDVCPEKCLEIGLQRERKAFGYGPIFYLHGLEGWSEDDLKYPGVALADWVGVLVRESLGLGQV